MKIIILDRDGVINYDSKDYIKSPKEWKPIPGSLEAIAQLNRHGYKIVIASNQSGIARGLFDMQTLNNIHIKLNLALSNVGGSIDSIFFCPHIDESNCQCRKPKPGMLLEIAKRYKVNISQIPFVGDSFRDLKAAEAAGAMPILVLSGNGPKTKRLPNLPRNTLIFDNLKAVTNYLIGDSIK